MKKLVPLIISAVLGGCYAEGAYYSTGGAVDLAYVAPGVSVIADYDEPIFYANGVYWYNAYGSWYSSPNYTGGWRYVAYPPYPIARIESPYAYRYYRPYGYTPRYRPVPAYRIHRPYIYDHQSARRDYNYNPGHRSYNPDRSRY